MWRLSIICTYPGINIHYIYASHFAVWTAYCTHQRTDSHKSTVWFERLSVTSSNDMRKIHVIHQTQVFLLWTPLICISMKIISAAISWHLKALHSLELKGNALCSDFVRTKLKPSVCVFFIATQTFCYWELTNNCFIISNYFHLDFKIIRGYI
jgi:hypothetical protein